MNDHPNSAVPGTAASVQNNSASVVPQKNQAQGNQTYAPDLNRLASALAVLDPDCDEYTWKFKRLAPMANTAKMFPDYEEDLRKLAIAWSRGDLHGQPSRAWVTPGGNGKSGKQIFNSVWARFYNGNFPGRPSTLGTIYFEARTKGWIPPEEQMASMMEDPE